MKVVTGDLQPMTRAADRPSVEPMTRTADRPSVRLGSPRREPKSELSLPLTFRLDREDKPRVPPIGSIVPLAKIMPSARMAGGPRSSGQP
jgi:hypothetical protein